MNLTRNEKIGIAVGAAVVVGAVALAAKSAAAATTPAPGPGITPSSHNWLVEMITPYPATYANIPLVQNDLIASAAASGFVLNTTAFGPGGLMIQPDPTNVPSGSSVPLGWVIIGTWNGQPPASIPLAASTIAAGYSGSISISPVAGSTWANSVVSSLPPQVTVNELDGSYYAFSVMTSFLSTVSGGPSAVAQILGSIGFGTVASFGSTTPDIGVTAAADPTNSTWNIVCRFIGVGTNTTTSTDLPPLLMFKSTPVLLPADMTASGVAGTAPAIGTSAGGAGVITVPATFPWTPT